MKLQYVIYSVFTGLAITSQAFGQNVIVNWGGDSVSAASSLNGFQDQKSISNTNVNPRNRAGRLSTAKTDTSSRDTIVGIPFSETNQLSPVSGYTGQRFYGGLSSGVINAAGKSPKIDRAQITNQGSKDVLDFRYALNGSSHDSHLAVYFNKADFLAGGADNKVAIDTSSSLSIRFNANTSTQVSKDGELRWIVREAGQWWISAANSAGQLNIRSQNNAGGSNGIRNQTTYTSTAAAGQLTYWALYDPITGGGLRNMNWEPTYSSTHTIASATNPFVPKTFTDITALGFYLEGDQFSTNVFQFQVESITFSTVVVPEPATYALIGLTGFFGLQWYLRRKPGTTEKPNETGEENELEPEKAAIIPA